MLVVLMLCSLVLVIAFLAAWLIAGGLLAGAVTSGIPALLDRVLDYKGPNCACHFPMKQHHHPAGPGGPSPS
jgi:hypothetical protein